MFTASPRRQQTPCSHSLNPTLLLESLLEHLGDFFGSLLGSTLNRAAAALLLIHFHPGADDESCRVVGSNEADNPQGGPRGFASAGINRARSEFAQSLSRHQVAFDRCCQL